MLNQRIDDRKNPYRKGFSSSNNYGFIHKNNWYIKEIRNF